MWRDTESDLDIDDPNDILFSNAAEQVQRTHAKLSSNNLLQLYAFYKQGTIGTCNTQQPFIFSVQERAKWNAWHDLGEMSKTDAKIKYIELVEEIYPDWVKNNTNPEDMKSFSNWVVHSIMAKNEDEVEEGTKSVYDFCKENNLILFRENLKEEQINDLDNSGMGFIHWAADRNAQDILKYLIECGADINLRDAEKQTALHYAATCGHLETIKLLIENHADIFLKDSDGQTCLDMTDNEDVRALLQRNKAIN